MTIAELLAAKGLRTLGDIDAARGNDSRYGFLVRTIGEVNADRVMRALEVKSWQFQRSAQ